MQKNIMNLQKMQNMLNSGTYQPQPNYYPQQFQQPAGFQQPMYGNFQQFGGVMPTPQMFDKNMSPQLAAI